MEWLSHAEEGLYISPPAASQPCCQLDPHSLSPVANSPPCPCRATPRVNSELLEPLQRLGADERKDKTKRSSPALALPASCPQLAQDCSSTICSLLLPKRPERDTGDESAALGAWLRMETTF